MHLLADARALGSKIDGIGRYSVGVLKALCSARPDWNISVISSSGGSGHLAELPVKVVSNDSKRFSLGENGRISRLIHSLDPDCYLNFSMAGPGPNVPTVLSVHDTMVLTVPGYFGKNMLKNFLSRLYFRRIIAGSLSHASVITTPSQASRNELVSIFPHTEHKILITGEGQDLFEELPQPASADSRDDSILYVGNARAYKNVTRLIVAYSRLKAVEGDFPDLKMIVRKDRAFRDFVTEVEDSHASEHIHVKCHVSDSELRDLYRNSRFLVMPSIKEGFGLPALEAMAAGTPVLASRGTALEELLGNAGLLVDPFSIGEIMAGMARLWTDENLWTDLSSRSQERARHYTWERTAGIIAEGIEEIV